MIPHGPDHDNRTSRMATKVEAIGTIILIVRPFFILTLNRVGRCPTIQFIMGSRRQGGGSGEPGGTRAMGVCEPGQGGNAAAISNTFMCLGEPPRLSRAPAEGLI